MDAVVKILHAIAVNQLSTIRRVFLVALACAVVYPMVTIITSLDGDSFTPFLLKFFLVLILVGTGIFPLWKWQWKWSALKPWLRHAIPIIFGAAILLFGGMIHPVRPLAVIISLLIASLGLLIIAVFCFSGRLLFALLIEATTSSEVAAADAEIPAKEVFRMMLGILAYEWFIAWFVITFSPQLTITTTTLAFLICGIVILTSYSLGFKGELGKTILFWSGLGILLILSLVLVDRMIEQGDLGEFFTKGYVGKELKSKTGTDSFLKKAVDISHHTMEWFIAISLMLTTGVMATKISGKKAISDAIRLATFLTAGIFFALWLIWFDGLTDVINELATFGNSALPAIEIWRGVIRLIVIVLVIPPLIIRLQEGGVRGFILRMIWLLPCVLVPWFLLERFFWDRYDPLIFKLEQIIDSLLGIF